MIIAPYKSLIVEFDGAVLKDVADNPSFNIDEENISVIPYSINGDLKEVYMTVLVSACFINNEELVDYILNKGANVNVGVDYNGNSCAHIAIQYGNLNILRKLIAHGFSLEDKRSWQRIALLHTAVYRKNYEIVKYLIELGADVNARHDNEFMRITPLVTAVELGSKDIVELLLDNGAENICPMIAKGVPRKDCLIAPQDFFVLYTRDFNDNIFEQSALTTLPLDIEGYYFKRFFDIICTTSSLENVALKRNLYDPVADRIGDQRWAYLKTIFQKHTAKIISLYPSIASKKYPEGKDKVLDSFRAECNKELNHMKAVPLVEDTDLSWYDAIFMEGSRLAEILNDKFFDYEIDDFEVMFPLYGGILYYNWLTGNHYCKLLDDLDNLTAKL